MCLYNGYQKFNIVKHHKKFIKKKEKLKLYIVKLKENSTIKIKIYLFNYIIRDNNQKSIILIIHNKYIFFVNNGIGKA